MRSFEIGHWGDVLWFRCKQSIILFPKRFTFQWNQCLLKNHPGKLVFAFPSSFRWCSLFLKIRWKHSGLLYLERWTRSSLPTTTAIMIHFLKIKVIRVSDLYVSCILHDYLRLGHFPTGKRIIYSSQKCPFLSTLL